MATNIAASVKVCIAEDNPILLEGLERALVANGYEVQTAPDGLSVLELLRDGELPDILLVDVMMPGMNGIEVLEAIRAEPRTSALPVLLITAAADGSLPGSKLDGREVEVLLKPFRLQELLRRIEHHVGNGKQPTLPEPRTRQSPAE